MLTIGSLFSGIGGLELGLEWAGLGPVVWQVENEPFCRSVLERHWSDADRSVTDVREANAANLAPVDLICGGFPCQDISTAGKGGGLSGARSGLWFEFARIISELGPSFVVVENVAALLGRGIGTILGSLADLGYDAIWDRVSAAELGAPHLRRRVFIVAHAPQLLGHAGEDHPGGGCSRARSDIKQSGKRARTETPGSSWWETEPDVGRVVDGVPFGSHRLAALGNAVVPQCAEVIGWVVRELMDAQ
jgi:DNA (cytosine-5)-methyltransferase 1